MTNRAEREGVLREALYAARRLHRQVIRAEWELTAVQADLAERGTRHRPLPHDSLARMRTDLDRLQRALARLHAKEHDEPCPPPPETPSWPKPADA